MDVGRDVGIEEVSIVLVCVIYDLLDHEVEDEAEDR